MTGTNNQITEHFTLAEATTSGTAARLNITNSIPDNVLPAVIKTAVCLEQVREYLNNPIHINSWYRSPELNKAIGGVDSSQHTKGEAVDFICPSFGSPQKICQFLTTTELSFDQLILEHTWVHISFSSVPSRKNRKQVLTLLSSGKYAVGLTTREGKLL